LRSAWRQAAFPPALPGKHCASAGIANGYRTGAASGRLPAADSIVCAMRPPPLDPRPIDRKRFEASKLRAMLALDRVFSPTDGGQ
jgi:hypothetical protein